MNFENYYEIYKVRIPAKFSNRFKGIDKNILEDFWNKAQEEYDVSDYIEEVESLKDELRDAEQNYEELYFEYSSATAEVEELKDEIDELKERLEKLEQ